MHHREALTQARSDMGSDSNGQTHSKVKLPSKLMFLVSVILDMHIFFLYDIISNQVDSAAMP